MLDPTPPFLGFGPRAIGYFEGLAADNSKAYFEANRATYDAEIREPFERLLGEVAERHCGPVKLFRPHRDVRFSKDKSPYKTTCAGYVAASDRTLYASLSAEGFYAGTGAYGMSKDQLQRFRDALIGAPGPAFEAAVASAEAAGLEVWGAALKTAPRGFPKDHALVRFLRMKEIVLGARVPPQAALGGRRPLEFALEVWAAAEPATDWLATHVGAAESSA